MWRHYYESIYPQTFKLTKHTKSRIQTLDILSVVTVRDARFYTFHKIMCIFRMTSTWPITCDTSTGWTTTPTSRATTTRPPPTTQKFWELWTARRQLPWTSRWKMSPGFKIFGPEKFQESEVRVKKSRALTLANNPQPTNEKSSTLARSRPNNSGLPACVVPVLSLQC